MSQEDHDLLIRIDTKLSNFVESVSNHIKDDAAQFTKLNVRLDFLEKAFWRLAGGISVVVVLASLVARLFI